MSGYNLLVVTMIITIEFFDFCRKIFGSRISESGAKSTSSSNGGKDERGKISGVTRVVQHLWYS